MVERRGKLFVISAPGGTGKTTLARLLTREFPHVVESVSFTSRKPRPGEVEGVDYHFISKEKFLEKIESGDFLEYAKVYNDLYGTDQKTVEALLDQGKDLLLVIDTQGAKSIKEKLPATTIFISPPSLEELKSRLEKRGRDKPEEIAKKMEWAEREIALSHQFDYQVMNDDLDSAYRALKKIIVDKDLK